MPTPVSNARQCLGDEAAAALEAAVSAARSRSHAQTTSLHVVFALLSSFPSSPSLLRDALSRVRSASSSPRLQLKAIEFCFGVSLDRLPSSSSSSSTPSSSDDPPISNSLMAAIKRSQAIQRRHPDTFHLYQQQQSSADPSSAFSGVKVELQQLVLAILDDPIVSRVFSSSGFRSSDIKFAIVRPPPAILSFPNPTRCPPLFLCNFSDTEGLGFPLPVADVGNENCRRIVEVIIRKSGSHNPMLVGVGAAEAAGDFIRALERRKWEGMPQEIHGLRIASIERELGGGNPDDIYEKLEKVGKESEDSRIALSIGDMQGLSDVSEEVIGCLVSEVTRVLELRPGKLWVLGWSATYETYLKLLSRYPLLEKDWALQLLPITSHRAGFGGLHPKPPSIMGSFVPFGGLFSPVEPMDSSSRPYKSIARCQLCNEKFEQEVLSIQKGSSHSLESLHQPGTPSWLKREDAVDMVEEDKDLLNAKIVNLQKKWNKYCQDEHGSSEMLKTNNSQALLHSGSIRCTSSMEVCCKNTINPYATQKQSICKDACTIPVGAPKTMPICTGIMLALASVPTNSNLISNLQDKLSDGKSLQSGVLESQQAAPLDLSFWAQHSTSPITSVPTDLVLGSAQEPFCLEGKPAFLVRADQSHDSSESSIPIKVSGSAQNVSEDHVSPHFVPYYMDSAAKSVDLYARFPSYVKSTHSAFSNEQRCRSTSSICQKFDSTNYKSLYMSLLGKVGRQEEALLAISEAIIHCKARSDKTHGTSLRDDIWLCFHGPDRVGKKMAAMALAESIFGSSDNFICIDLAYVYDTFCTNTACEDQGLKVHDNCLRGKTIIDHISMEIRTKPLSVFFLENVEKADLLAQSSLSNAIRTGKFSDSRGREFSVNSSIFVVAAKDFPGAALSPREQIVTFSEERISAVQKCQMKILVEPPSEILISSPDCKVSNVKIKDSRSMYVPHHPVIISKRKMDSIEDQNRLSGPLLSVKKSRQNLGMVLDLNLPVDEALDQCGDCSSSNEVSFALGNSEAWFEELISIMDATVSFKPFDFDALSDYVLKEIGQHLRKEIGPNSMLEIDVKVMEQILAATWLLKNKNDLTEWIEKVLMRSLANLRDKKGSASTVFRLIGCQDLLKESQPWAFLPLKISLQ